MEFLLDSQVYQYLVQYISGGMLIVIPVLMFIGYLLKDTPKVPTWLVPYILIVLGIIAGIIILPVVVEGVIQGVLVAAVAVLSHQLYKQYKEKNKNKTE